MSRCPHRSTTWSGSLPNVVLKGCNRLHGRSPKRYTATTLAPRSDRGRHTQPAPSLSPGLTRTDALLLSETIREALVVGYLVPLDWNAIKARAEEAGLTGDALIEAVHALAEADYIDVRIDGNMVSSCDLTRLGYAVGVAVVLPDVEDARRRVVAVLVNDPPTGDRIIHDLAERVDTHRLVVDELLQDLEDRDLVSVSRTMGDHSRLRRVSPTLGRLLA